jgi:hypothetical protein
MCVCMHVWMEKRVRWRMSATGDLQSIVFLTKVLSTLKDSLRQCFYIYRGHDESNLLTVEVISSHCHLRIITDNFHELTS